MIVTPGRIDFQAVLLNDCVRWAYGLADYQIVGLPSSISGSRWDIEAKAEGPATDAELRQMFRVAALSGEQTRAGVIGDSRAVHAARDDAVFRGVPVAPAAHAGDRSDRPAR